MSFQQIYHAILPDRTVTFFTEEERDNFISGDESDENFFVKAHSFILKDELHRMQNWATAHSSAAVKTVTQHRSESSINPDLDTIQMFIQRDMALRIIRWFYSDAGWISSETQEGLDVQEFLRRLEAAVKPTEEERRAHRVQTETRTSENP